MCTCGIHLLLIQGLRNSFVSPGNETPEVVNLCDAHNTGLSIIFFCRIKGSQNDGYQQLFSKDSDDSGEDTELFVRKKYEIPHIEKAVEEGDSLQSLAIRYHCTVRC